MKRNRISSHESRQSKPRTVHITDHIAILREHKWVALVPFLLILGGAVALTLLATPVYQAEGLVAIETEGGAAGILGELQLADTAAKVEAEMEIMQSRRVANGAVDILASPCTVPQDPEQREAALAQARRMGDFLVEVNRFRPLEVMLRAYLGAPPPCTVELECEPLPDGNGPEHYHFHFLGEAGGGRHSLEVIKIHEKRFGSERQTERVEVHSDKPFTAFGRSFRLTVDGNPRGRVYSVRLRNREDLANWVRASTVVSQLGRNTGIVALGSKAETPRLAQSVATALALSFEQTKNNQKRGDASKAVEFLTERVLAIETQLASAEAELAAFQDKHGVTILSERAKQIVDALGELERARVELELREEEQQRVLERLADIDLDANGLALHATGDDPVADALASQLTELQLEYATLREELTDEFPRVKSVLVRLHAARERLRAHLLARARAQGELTRKRLEHNAQEYERLDGKAKQLPEQERELASLTREATSLVAIHNFLLEKLHEAQITRESVFSNVRIVDRPVLPRVRTSPNLLINVLVGFFLAILAALGTAFFAEYLDRSVKTPEELEQALGLPLYAALPAFKSVRSRELRKLKSAMVTIEKPSSVLAEGYRSLRANIRFADFESPVRAFAITSAVLGEGKTTTTLNLAVVLAQAGSKVIVVDADLRRPATHAHLKGKLSPGLSDVLQQKCSWQSVKSAVSGVENLDVIHGGQKPENPGALFDSDHFTKLIEDLKGHYEYVLFDVPPVLAVSDAASFFRRLDALFLLVQWRRCPIDVVRAAKEQGERLGAKLRGVIFNGFDARKSGRRGYGHYGYYGYYGYYGKYRGYGYGYGYVSDRERKGKAAEKTHS